MKILITTDTFYPMINGVVISTYNLYKELKNLGHDVKILTLSEDGRERIEGDIYYLGSIHVRIYPGAKIKKPFTEGIVRKIIEWEPELIHSQTEFSTMITAKYIAKKLQIPQLHTYHTMYEDYLKYILNGKLITPKAAGTLIKLLLNRMDGVIAPTEKVEDALNRYGVRTDTFVIPTGIDLNKFKTPLEDWEKVKLLNDLGLSEKDDIMVYIGRIAYEKNIDELISMFCKIKTGNKNIKFLIVGGGPYLDNLRNLVKDLNMEKDILFTGMVDSKEINKYYKLGNVFVTASTSETQGLTYIEALASGLPVVCRYDKCVEGVITDENGAIYNNESEFIETITSLFADKSYRIELSQNALKSSYEFSSVRFAQRVENVYSQLIMKYNAARLSFNESAI